MAPPNPNPNPNPNPSRTCRRIQHVDFHGGVHRQGVGGGFGGGIVAKQVRPGSTDQFHEIGGKAVFHIGHQSQQHAWSTERAKEMGRDETVVQGEQLSRRTPYPTILWRPPPLAPPPRHPASMQDLWSTPYSTPGKTQFGETEGTHRENTEETPRKHRGNTEKTPRKHRGNIEGTSRKHRGNIEGTSA